MRLRSAHARPDALRARTRIEPSAPGHDEIGQRVTDFCVRVCRRSEEGKVDGLDRMRAAPADPDPRHTVGSADALRFSAVRHRVDQIYSCPEVPGPSARWRRHCEPTGCADVEQRGARRTPIGADVGDDRLAQQAALGQGQGSSEAVGHAISIA